MLLENFEQSTGMFKATSVLYILAFVFYAIAFIPGKKNVARLATAILAIALISNTAIIVDRWVEGGRPPFKTLYETMLFYPWCVSAVFFILYGLYGLSSLGIFTAVINIFGFAYACYKPDIEIINLPPALQSGWFVPHVVTYFISYAGLFASCALAALYLKWPEWKKAETEIGFELMYNRALDFGFCALTFGLVMGAIWGKVAWGDYWAWDPKENWALITWFIYLIAIHLRFVKSWRGKRAAVVAIVGFGAVIFTYLGMTLLPTAQGSLHVYQ